MLETVTLEMFTTRRQKNAQLVVNRGGAIPAFLVTSWGAMELDQSRGVELTSEDSLVLGFLR